MGIKKPFLFLVRAHFIRFNTIGSERKAGTKTGEKIKNDKIRQWKRTKEEAFSAKIRKSLRVRRRMNSLPSREFFFFSYWCCMFSCFHLLVFERKGNICLVGGASPPPPPPVEV